MTAARSVLVTGVSRPGGIGEAIARSFGTAGYNVVATGRPPAYEGEAPGSYISADLARIAAEPEALAEFVAAVREATADAPLCVLVNNAALQVVKPTEDLTQEEIGASFAVNAIAPFLLAKSFIPELRAAKGAVINIGTVHARATKPGFAAYAASKTAIHGLTRALAVDLGPDIRVNTLAPAATATAMLKAGFQGREDAYHELEAFHPAGRIASPEEIGEIAVLMASGAMSFMTGATVYADGGVLSRLHDPV